MMTPQELAQHEAIKKLLKQAIDNNPNLTPIQKMIAKNRRTASQLDNGNASYMWVFEIENP